MSTAATSHVTSPISAALSRLSAGTGAVPRNSSAPAGETTCRGRFTAASGSCLNVLWLAEGRDPESSTAVMEALGHLRAAGVDVRLRIVEPATIDAGGRRVGMLPAVADPSDREALVAQLEWSDTLLVTCDQGRSVEAVTEALAMGAPAGRHVIVVGSPQPALSDPALRVESIGELNPDALAELWLARSGRTRDISR